MKNPKIALALFPFIDELKKDLIGTLLKIKLMGYDGVEFAGGLYYDPIELKNALDQTGLEIVGWHTNKYFLSDDLIGATLNYMNLIGNKNIVIPCLPEEDTENKEKWIKTSFEFNNLSQKLKAYNKRIGYHNHTKEFKKVDGKYMLDIFCENIDREVFIQLDIGNMMSCGEIPEKFLSKYPNRFKTIHVKPYSLKNKFATVVGEDDINYKSIINECISNGGTEWFIIEYENEEIYDKYTGAEICKQKFNYLLENQ